MMILLTVWIIFTIIIGFSKCNTLYYIFLSLIMFYLTYSCNKLFAIQLTIRNTIIISFLPNFLFGYLFYKCNEFLWIYSYNWENFIALLFVYSYILIYIAIECE